MRYLVRVHLEVIQYDDKGTRQEFLDQQTVFDNINQSGMEIAVNAVTEAVQGLTPQPDAPKRR